MPPLAGSPGHNLASLERIPIQLTHNRATRSVCSLSNPKSGLPDFGHIEWSKSDKSDFDGERGGVRGTVYR